MRLTGTSKLRSVDRHFRGIAKGTPVVVGLVDPHRHREPLREAGFPDPITAGDSVLPAPKGNVSRFNAEGGEIIHRDQPMETAYRQMEWTWEEWHGPYDRVKRSKIVDVPYQRYPRTPIPPPSIELIAANDVSGEMIVITQPLDYTDANAEALLHRVNLLRELFGEAELLTDNLSPFLDLKLRRLNWDVLPPGEMPWPRLRKRLDPVLREFGERSGPVVEERLRTLTEDHTPDFSAVGRAGFRGYIIFGFKDKALYVLESLEYGNATYVLGKDWETLSQMTKAEILQADLHEHRVIHREGWEGELRGILR